MRQRYFNYLIMIEEGGSIIFNKRNNNDIWKNLYDFPLIETGKEIAQGELPGNKTWNEWLAGPVTIEFASKPYRHQLTHQKIIARFYIIYIRAGEKIPLQAGWERIPRKRVKTLAVPRLIEKFMDDHQEYFKKKQTKSVTFRRYGY